MAAIQTDREIVATELDPRYIQVILQRIKTFKPEWEIKHINGELTEDDIL